MNEVAPKPNGIFPRLTEVLEAGPQVQTRPTAQELRDLEETLTASVLRAIPSQPDSQSEYLIRKAANEIAATVMNQVSAQIRLHVSEIMQDAIYRALERELSQRRLR